MKTYLLLAAILPASLLGFCRSADAKDDQDARGWTSSFAVDDDELSTTGRNPFFILEPGYQLMLEGKETGKPLDLTITVLDETRKVDGVETRVVEERETRAGQVVEISRNFFAISKRTNSVYYFGEEVDIYRDGKVVSHEGAWLSGVDGAKFGLAMPGTARLGARYQQEVAPHKAMDWAEIVSLSEKMETPAGSYDGCLKVEETTPLEPGEREHKYYARGVGLLRDGPTRLVRAGFLRN